ncbi:hypothetical protein MAP00_000781 [Monascus purpureus]|nr:hypothetical protein MAP00_000781 [Monascus purpureus]
MMVDYTMYTVGFLSRSPLATSLTQALGSMNAVPTLAALGLPPDGEPDDTHDKAFERIQKKVFEHDAAELDELMNEKYRQAGTMRTLSMSISLLRAAKPTSVLVCMGCPRSLVRRSHPLGGLRIAACLHHPSVLWLV